MPVYFIQAGEAGPVKIGYSAAPELRLTKAQSDNHERLSIIGIMPGGTAEEDALHKRFADHRIHGDWFRPDPAVLAIADEYRYTPTPCHKPRPWPADSGQWGVIDGLAAELGVTYEARKKWRQRNVVPFRWHVPLLTLAQKKRKPLDVKALSGAPLRSDSAA